LHAKMPVLFLAFPGAPFLPFHLN